MPPKARFTKAEITKAALDILREDDAKALTARALGKRLGSSACPVFTAFDSMEEVRQAAFAAARAEYTRYVEKGLSQTPAFKGVGMQYIRFAMREPRLFSLLFMSEQVSRPDIGGVLPLIEDSYDRILASITATYGVTESDACTLYRHLWVYTHGIAALCATKTCCFTEDELGGMLTEVFTALLRQVKGAPPHD